MIIHSKFQCQQPMLRSCYINGIDIQGYRCHMIGYETYLTPLIFFQVFKDHFAYYAKLFIFVAFRKIHKQAKF